MICEFIVNRPKDTPLKKLLAAVKVQKNCSVFGLNFGEKSWLLEETNRPILFVTNTINECQKLKDQMESLHKSVSVLLLKQENYLISKTVAKDNLHAMIDTMYQMTKNKVDVLIITPDLLMQRLPEKQQFSDRIITLKLNQQVGFDNIIQNLIKNGFVRQDMINSVGEFSLRGDILDVFPCNEASPIRIQFFDDVIESIERFELATFKSYDKLKKVDICPNTLTFITDTWSQIEKQIEASCKKQEKVLSPDAAIHLKSLREEILLKLQNKSIDGMEGWILPFLNNQTRIVDYMPPITLAVFDDVKQIVDGLQLSYDQFYESMKTLLAGGEILPEHELFYFTKSQAFDFANQKLSFQQITTANRIFNPDSVFSFQSAPVTGYFGRYQLLLSDLQYYLEFKNTVVIFTKNLNSTKYLQKFLLDNQISVAVMDDFASVKPQQVNLITKQVCYGADFVEDNIVIIGSTELFGKQENKAVTVKDKKENFSLPKVGDYVVHETFGIGKCAAIQKMKFTDYEKDYIVLEYERGDKLYLPTEQIGLISAYNGTGKEPKLNRLGGQEFAKTKERVKQSLKELAFNLVKLYAEREHLKGFRYELDAPLFKEFENAFPFEETADQLEAINDIKADMTGARIMDRIICGDVGYGKTEVALRAAFLAIMNGKQVAFLAPTTILSEQHYNTCLSRLAPFSASVRVLNRFKTGAEQKQIIKKLKEGTVDIVCGTHRLLSKDVQFKNLGLLILDEEQRFGVADKEKIKLLKSNVDVLTLSATPIPRTLHMGLVGIRDISLISTPPEGRLPIQTMVVEYSDALLVQAVNRELMRNGQVLMIYNEIESIFAYAEHVRSLLPAGTQIGVAHGQMDGKLLEKQILDLYQGKTQVLISTTLIENGVDLPNANTLFIVNADKLGLSTLYQLRGRVGRSKNLGYAYFTYHENKVLSEDAYKRLNAIMEFTSLGSGFKIAMKDLEIRGCGNIMGKEQHGHMEKVGYDMYVKILNQAVSEIRGEQNRELKEVKIEVALDSFIPETYIDQSENRFRIYNNLITIDSVKSREEVLKEIEDIYGKLPQEVVNLSLIAFIRSLSRKLDIKKVIINKTTTTMEFYSKESLLAAVSEMPQKSDYDYSLSFAAVPIISFRFGSIGVLEKTNRIIQLLLKAVGNKK